MAKRKIQLDVSSISETEELHELLKQTFGFPDFYGKNINALIDCLSSLRIPEDGMSTYTLEPKDNLVVQLLGMKPSKNRFVDGLTLAFKTVNEREVARGEKPMLFLRVV